nr:reverse transcriptase domain-containing protein [Tanacetum cinerariifolium]
GDDANKHLDKFLHVTQSIKVNGVTDDAHRLYLFPHSLTHHVTTWFNHLPRNSINTFEQMAKMFLEKYFPPSMVTKLRNEITNFRQRPDESLFKARERYKLSIDQCGSFMKRHPEKCYDLIENMTAHHNDWDTSTQRTTVGQTQNVNAAGAYQVGNSYQPQGSETLPSNTITNPMEDLKGITTQSGNAYQGFTIPTTSSSSPEVVERKTNVIKDTVPPTNNGSTKDVKPSVIQIRTPIPNSELVVAPVAEPVVASISTPKPNQKPSISYPSRLHDQKLRDKANDQKKKFFQIIKDLDFNFSFMDALILMPKFSPTIKSLLTNKDKLFELARTPLNEHCSAFDLSSGRVAEDVFVKTGRALIDVYAGEITLRVNNEAVTFNLDQTLRYSANYNDMTANRIDVIDMAYEEYSQEVLCFSDVIATKNDKSSIDEPPEVKLKDLPPHLEYAFLEGDHKLPVIIAKDLSVEEKAALIKVLKSRKQAIAWKLFNIKGAVLGQRHENYFRPIHYASKTMTEAKSHYTTTEKEMLSVVYAFKKFRFGTPRAIISDHGMHFCNDQFAKVMLKYGVTHRLATSYHPQTSRQVEVSSCGLKRILERTVGENRTSWSDKLDDALWAFRTTFKTPIGCTPYKLIYRKACHLLIELEHKDYWALKHANFDLQTAEKTKKLHDSKIKDRVFNVGDRVLLFKSRLKIFSGKLKTRWSRPFTIIQVFPYGTIELSQTDGPNFKTGHLAASLGCAKKKVATWDDLAFKLIIPVWNVKHRNFAKTLIHG